MLRITFTITKQDQDLIEEELFALGVSSVSTTPVDDDTLLITALTEAAEEITARFSEKNPTVETVQEADWKDRWLDHYHGSWIGDETFAGPDLSAPEAVKARYFLHLDPRDAFGDGGHPTTGLCIRELGHLLKGKSGEERRAMRLLDAGTGSGIIAIYGEKAGIGTIDGVELDPKASARAEENLQRNACKNITLHTMDIASFSPDEKYHVVVANLLTEIILKNLHLLKKFLLPGGSLVISGIGRQWDTQVRDALENEKLDVDFFSEKDNWCCYRVKISP